jgi:hypothetical protein
VRKGRRCLARDLTMKDVKGVREPERVQLLRRARELDHPVELGSAIARMPRQAQGNAVPARPSDTRGVESRVAPFFSHGTFLR